MAVNHGLLALVFLLIVIKATAKQSFLSTTDPLSLIKSLASSGRAPVIVVIEPKTSESTLNLNELLGNDGARDLESLDNDKVAKEEAKTMLYNYLRSSPYDSPQEKEKKHALREALRQRCTQITVCIRECQLAPKRPRRPKNSCPQVCENNYDREQLCPPVRKWASTRPPRWLL